METHAAHADDPLEPDALIALQTIAEPNRARLLTLLGHGEHCVCDAGLALGMSPALVSHHLRTLRASGLVRERRSGRWVFYSLDLARLAAFRAIVMGLLTPTDAAAATCLCSDCGPTVSAAGQDSLRHLPLLAEVGS